MWLSSKGGRDSMITARVEDVSANGQATQVSAGWCAISLRALNRSRTAYDDGLMSSRSIRSPRPRCCRCPSGSRCRWTWRSIPRAGTSWPGTPCAHTPGGRRSAPTASCRWRLNSVGATLSVYHDAKPRLRVGDTGSVGTPTIGPASCAARPTAASARARPRARRTSARAPTALPPAARPGGRGPGAPPSGHPAPAPLDVDRVPAELPGRRARRRWATLARRQAAATSSPPGGR